MAREFKNYKVDEKRKKDVEDVISQYEGKSEDELMNEIINNYTESIANGTISKAELDKFIANAKNYLNQEQYAKLLSIANKLKNL